MATSRKNVHTSAAREENFLIARIVQLLADSIPHDESHHTSQGRQTFRLSKGDKISEMFLLSYTNVTKKYLQNYGKRKIWKRVPHDLWESGVQEASQLAHEQEKSRMSREFRIAGHYR